MITLTNGEEFNSILDALSIERIFSITKNDDGSFEFREQCDKWYCLNLTKEQMFILADEIRSLAIDNK